MNTRERTIGPVQPYIALCGCDTEDEYIDTTYEPLKWTDIIFITSELHYEYQDDKVVVTRHGAGIYEVTVQLCANEYSVAPNNVQVQLYVNGVALSCCKAYAFTWSKPKQSSLTLICSVYLSAGDYVQAYVKTDQGSATIVEGTCRFHMKGISMDKWNNKRAGGTKYPFRQEG